jgi:hypothetical protein
MAAKYNIKVDQGSTRDFYVRPKQPGGEPFDFDGYGARMQIRQTFESATPLLELTTANGGITFPTAAQMLADWSRDEDGWLKVSMTATQTTAITAGTYVYDIEVYTGTFVQRVIEGSIQFRREVTR